MARVGPMTVKPGSGRNLNAISALARFVASATQQFRKGPEIVEHDAGSMHVVEVFDMPHEDEAPTVTVDVGFLTIGFTEHAADKTGFIGLLKAALNEPGEFHTFTVDEFKGGPSYITTGAWIGDQGLALCLYALLEHYELAEVVTPAKIGITGDRARELMGSGFVMFSATPALREALSS